MADRKLSGRRVLLTRPKEGAEEFKRKLEFQGAEVINFPLIELSLKEDLEELDRAFETFEEYEWVVFNSPAAVRFFFQKANDHGLKLYFYPDLKFATVGEKTKLTLEQLGYRTNFVPIKYTAEVLANNMPDIEGKNILIPASELTSGNYIEVFEKRGAHPHLIKVYENKAVQYEQSVINDMIDQKIDYITFTSGSAVEAFVNMIGKPSERMTESSVICIGPSTAAVAQEHAIFVNGIAEPHTVEGMVELMKELEK